MFADKMDGALYEGIGVALCDCCLPAIFLHDADGFKAGELFHCDIDLLRPLTPAARAMLTTARTGKRAR